MSTAANVVALQDERPSRSLVVDMADRYGMEPDAFKRTVIATCMPQNSKPEEFLAFLLVAKEYHLNPITREIYAFPKKGGGIVPIVGVDGWVSLVNSHGKCNGFEFVDQHDEKGNLVSCTCRMYRKDREHPVVVTEYLDECIRGTDPWKMKHRMLRHKAMIQAARYAFGFSGIYDEDEGEKIAEARDVTPRPAPPTPPSVPTPPAAKSQQEIEGTFTEVQPAAKAPPEPPKPPQADAGDIPAGLDRRAKPAAAPAPTAPEDPEALFKRIEERLSQATDADELATAWEEVCPDFVRDELFPPDQEVAIEIWRRHEKRLEP